MLLGQCHRWEPNSSMGKQDNVLRLHSLWACHVRTPIVLVLKQDNCQGNSRRNLSVMVDPPSYGHLSFNTSFLLTNDESALKSFLWE